MSKHEHAENEPAEPRRRWQFGLIHLLLIPAALGLALGFFIGCYPYSLMMLPFFLVVLIPTVGWSLLPASSFRPAGALAVSTGIYVLMTMLAPPFVDFRETSRRCQCANNLKQITLALHVYHNEYGCFPPAYLADQDGKPMHSWRVLILPFMDEQALFDQYRFDEPWDGPNNSLLAGARVRPYECPEQSAAGTPITTSYVAVVGPGTVWPGMTTARCADVSDGTSSTLMLVEMADSGIHWMEPRDLDAATMAASVNTEGSQGISSLHRDPGWQRQRLGANTALADGSVLFLPTSTPETLIRALITAAGGEPIERDERGRIQL